MKSKAGLYPKSTKSIIHVMKRNYDSPFKLAGLVQETCFETTIDGNIHGDRQLLEWSFDLIGVGKNDWKRSQYSRREVQHTRFNNWNRILEEKKVSNQLKHSRKNRSTTPNNFSYTMILKLERWDKWMLNQTKIVNIARQGPSCSLLPRYKVLQITPVW